MTTARFDYDAAFDRNVGLVTPTEVDAIRKVRVGIGGLGGCGSNHLLALVRMGFERFAIADPDHFELANMNRQSGALVSTIGRSKVDVMAEMARAINPNISIDVAPQGITPESIRQFAEDVDIAINAIDFLAIDLYASFHDTFRDLGRYSLVGASPFAFGASLTVLGPETPSFGESFGIACSDPPEDKLRKFVRGMTPVPFASSYVEPGVNEVRTPLSRTRISSSAAALQLCTALTAAEVLFVVLGRRQPTLAPRVLQVDLFMQKCSIGTMASSSGPSTP